MEEFRRLEIWRVAFELTKIVYRVTFNFPKEELYGLTSQLRRAVVSIPSNIAEGCGRRTDKDFRGFLYNALGSLREVETQILIAKELGYSFGDDSDSVVDKVDELGAKLSRFIWKVSERC